MRLKLIVLLLFSLGASYAQERICIQTDKPYYVPGDTVWLRAHLMEADTNIPFSRSRFVYVELYDQQSDTLMQQIDSLTFPKVALPHYALTESPDLSTFRTQAQTQQMYSRAGYIELPEVTKIGKKQKPLRRNFMNMEAPRGFQEGDPRIERAVTMQQLLINLGMRVAYTNNGEPYITTPDNAGVLPYVDNFREEDHSFVLNLLPTDVKSIEYFTPNNAINGLFAARPANHGKVPGVLFIFLKDGSEIASSRAKDSPSFVSVRQLGYRPAMEFYSPQYKSTKSDVRTDHRTTLYWNPKVETDEKGHASVKFYASDVSKRYLVTLEGVSNDGTIVHHQQIIE